MGFNKKTLVGDVLNDQRLPRREIVENGPFTFFRLSAAEMDFFFPVRQSAHCCQAATRGQSECGEQRRALAAGKQPCCECDKEGGLSHNSACSRCNISPRGIREPAVENTEWVRGRTIGKPLSIYSRVVKTPLIVAPTLNPTRPLALKNQL